MTSHVCSKCGEITDCPNRNVGTGRQKPLYRYGANHAAVHGILTPMFLGPGWPADTKTEGLRWWTVRQLQGELDFRKVVHAGKRATWNYVAVQSVCSDLVGWKYAEMVKVPRSREWMYRFVRPHVPVPGVRKGRGRDGDKPVARVVEEESLQVPYGAVPDPAGVTGVDAFWPSQG